MMLRRYSVYRSLSSTKHRSERHCLQAEREWRSEQELVAEPEQHFEPALEAQR